MFPGEGCSRLHPHPLPQPWAHALLPCPASRGSATVHTPTAPPTWAAGTRQPRSTAPAGVRGSWGCAQNTRSTTSRRHVAAPSGLCRTTHHGLQKKTDSCRPLPGHVSPGRAGPPAWTERLPCHLPQAPGPQLPNRAQGPPLSEQLPGGFLPGGAATQPAPAGQPVLLAELRATGFASQVPVKGSKASDCQEKAAQSILITAPLMGPGAIRSMSCHQTPLFWARSPWSAPTGSCLSPEGREGAVLLGQGPGWAK